MKKTSVDLQLLETLARQGRTIAAIAQGLGLSAGTVFARLKDDAEFQAAFERGKAARRGKYVAAENQKQTCLNPLCSCRNQV